MGISEKVNQHDFGDQGNRLALVGNGEIVILNFYRSEGHGEVMAIADQLRFDPKVNQ